MPTNILELSIDAILNHKDLRVDFIFFVNKIHAQESLLFWMEVEMYKMITDSDECFRQAKLLYCRYIHPNARAQINVSCKHKEDLDDIMATGIWDQTLFDAIQANVHECLRFGVVRDFAEYMGKRVKSVPDPDSASFVMLERYEHVMHRKDKEKDLYGSQRVKAQALAGWLRKKSQITTQTHTQSSNNDEPSKSHRIKSSFLGKARAPIPKMEPEVHIEPELENNRGSIIMRRRSRMSPQKLQEQIQLLRNLQLQQNQEMKMDKEEFPTLEFSAKKVDAPQVLSKSASMPSIMARGVSLANFRSIKSS